MKPPTPKYIFANTKEAIPLITLILDSAVAEESRSTKSVASSVGMLSFLDIVSYLVNEGHIYHNN